MADFDLGPMYDEGVYSYSPFEEFSDPAWDQPAVEQSFPQDYEGLISYLSGAEPSGGYDVSPWEPSLWDQTTSWLGDNWKDALGLGVQLAGAYGNYASQQAMAQAQSDQAKAALKRVALDNRMAKANQAQDMMGKASISNILANRGHLAAGQSNPWLNYLYQAQKEARFTPQGENPFAGYDVGQAVTPYSMDQLMAGLEGMNRAAPQASFAGGGAVKGALGALRGLNVPHMVDRGMDVGNLPKNWLADNQEALIADYLQNMRRLSDRMGTPMDEELEQQKFLEMLQNTPQINRAKGGLGLVGGTGGGQDDLVDARLSVDEYVMDADTVAALGDGSPSEGARKLDKMRERVRKHKRSAPASKIPPKAKDPMVYLKG